MPIVPLDDGPCLQLNQLVPLMSFKEAIIGVYCYAIPRVIDGGEILVLVFWLHTLHDIRNEMFLAAVGLSRSCDKDNLD